MEELPKSALAVKQALEGYGIDFEIREFPEGTRTSRDAASAIGCELGQIAKSIVFSLGNGGEAVLVIASGANRVDTAKVGKAIGNGPVKMMEPEGVKQLTGFPVGGVPPIGHKTEIRKLIDKDLMRYELVWAAAGSPDSVFSIRPGDLVRITQGQPMEVKE